MRIREDRKCVMCVNIFRVLHTSRIKTCSYECSQKYKQSPEVKERLREYQRRPDVRAKLREYQRRPENRIRQKEYRVRAEVKAKRRKKYGIQQNRLDQSKAQTHQTIVKVNDLWETPSLTLDDAMTKYDIHPVLDVCATSQNAKFEKYFTPEQDGLIQEWSVDFFMNPPYSQINQWMQKAYEQYLKYNVNALILVFAKTSVEWWHEYVEGKAEVHFQEGRIRFLLNGIEPRYCIRCKFRFVKEISHCENCQCKIGKSRSTYNSVWVIFRKDEKID